MVKKTNKGEDRVLWSAEVPKAKSAAAKWNILPPILLLMVLFIGGSLFYVWSRIQVIQLGYEISNALKKERALVEANQKLRLEVATLKSYSRIEKLAVERFGMRKPEADQVIVIR